MKKRIMFISLFLIIGLILIYIITIPKETKWIYDNLPNNYIIKKFNDNDVRIGKLINEKFKTTKDNKKIGVDNYIAEFSYGKNYIGLKCIDNANNNIEVIFYIIDSINEDVYGPYDTEEVYLEVKERIVDEELTNWIKTIDM